MLRLKQAIGAYMLATTLLPTIAAQATTYYVSTNGSDSNNGTSESTPFNTINKAATVLINPGDTAYIKNGTYTSDSKIRLRYSGTQAAPIRLLAYPGHSPVLHFNDDATTYELLEMEILSYQGHMHPISWIVIEGITFEGGARGIHAYACDHCTFRRNWFKDPYGSGILIWSAIDTVIDRNVISDAGSTEGGAHGLYLTGSRYIITNNLIYGSEKFGIQMNGSMSFNPNRFPTQEYSDTKDAIIANNVVAYSKNGSGIVVWGATNDNMRIENNIFYENWSAGPATYPNGINCVSCSGSTGITIRNNIFYATGSGGLLGISASLVEGDNYTQSGNFINTSNPGFVNAPATLPASPNFKLNERSPAIDRGLPLTTIAIDFDGIPRPQGRTYDIGAYEFHPGTDTQSPAVPLGLHAH